MEWLIFGIISLLVGAAQSATQRHYNKIDAQELYEQQLEDQREDRRTEFQMESPVALAQQMKQAGQNPAAAVGTGGSVNHVATTSPFTPTSFDPTSAFTGAAQTAFQAKQMKMMETSQELTNEKTRAETFNIWQDGIRKQIENGALPEQLQAMIENIREDIAKKKTDRQLGEMQIAFLEDAKAKGINPVEDDHNLKLAQINQLNNQSDYIKAQTDTVNALRDGQVTAQTLQNMSSVFEYQLRLKYGDKMADLDFRQLKQEVERDERLREVYVELAKNQQASAAYNAAIDKLTYEDLKALPPWQRYMLTLGKEVVSKGAEVVF